MVWNDICALGRREGVAEAADPQAVGSCVELWTRDCRKHTADIELVPLNHDSMTERLVGTIYSVEKKEAAAGRALDQAVDVAGSRLFFGGVLAAITGWAIAGAVTGGPDLWQIILQDASSIQCYISDMILMRQQMNDFREHLRIIALLRSRSYTITKCFRLLIEQERLETAARALHSERSLNIAKLSSAELARLSSRGHSHMAIQTSTNLKSSDSFQVTWKTKPAVFHDLEGAARELDAIGDAISLAPEDFIDRVIVITADVMGSIWMLIAFVIGMVVWIALGPKYNFSNNWQLWLNTCTALQQTLSTSLLTLARNRHTNFIERCMCAIFRQDCEVEYRARTLIGYDGPNEVVKIEWAAEHRFERSLDWYASFIGSGYAALISLVLFVVWLAIGHLMSWGDNWWLIVGTWTGVVGTFNAAVLRYNLYRQEEKAEAEYDILIEQDKAIFKELGLPCTNQVIDLKPNLMTRLSTFTSWVCATPWAVLATLCLILGLLIGATVVLWNETAQLLVNSVTMIVESFFLIVLIDAHNVQATQHRVRLHDLLMRRLQLLVIHRRVEMDEVSSMDSFQPSESDSLLIDKTMLS
ncbi:hypothetical protein Ndes2526A_g09556 [Nannochloris sp. 'desiccata']